MRSGRDPVLRFIVAVQSSGVISNNLSPRAADGEGADKWVFALEW
jgi:hypothetical protein